MNELLKRWQDENNRLTKEQCSKLLRELKKKCLDPILRELRGEYGASMSFAKIIGGYSAIEQGYKRDAKGAKDVRAQEFCDFHPVGVCGISFDQLKTFKSVQRNRARYKQSRGQTIGQTNIRI